MITPKEVGGTASPTIYPRKIEYSAKSLTALNYGASTPDKVDIAFCFKIAASEASKILNDPSNHYLILIQKSGGSVSMYCQGYSLGSKSTTATNLGGLLKECLNHWAGGWQNGVISNMIVVDGHNNPYNAYYQQSEAVPGLWVCREAPQWFVEKDEFVGGTSIASSSYPGYDKSNAINGPANSDWACYAGTQQGWIGCHLTSARVLTKYTIIARANTNGEKSSPVNFTFEGSNNGSTWTVLDTHTGETGWGNKEKRSFTFSNTTAYSYYRLNITKTDGSPHAGVSALIGYSLNENEYGAHGGLYEFKDASSLGRDSSGKGNHWSISGAQSDDTPSQNGGKAAWRAFPWPRVWPHEHFFQAAYTAQAEAARIQLPWDNSSEKWVMQLSTPDGEFLEWYDSERPAENVTWRMDGSGEVGAGGNCHIEKHGDVSRLVVGGGCTTAGKKYIVTVWRCGPGSPFDVVRVNHTQGSDTVFSHTCGAKPNFILQKGLTGSAHKPPHVYYEPLGADTYGVYHTNSPFQSGSGTWSPLGSTQGSVNTTFNSGEYVVYLFAPPLSVTASYAQNNSAAGPVVNLGGRPAFLWFDATADQGICVQVDGLRNDSRNPWEDMQYVNSHAGSHTQAGMLSRRSNGYRQTSTFMNGNTSWSNVAWAIIDQHFKYSNAVL